MDYFNRMIPQDNISTLQCALNMEGFGLTSTWGKPPIFRTSLKNIVT